MSREIKMYGGKVFGEQVSSYGINNGYLDYRTLARIVGDCILNNTIYSETYPDDWEIVSGQDYYEEGDDIEYYDIYQFYIISYEGYVFLREYTDEIVYYNNELDVYLWGVTHFGTSWDYVLTDIKLVEMEF